MRSDQGLTTAGSGTVPGEPFPNPVSPPIPSENPPVDPIGVPAPGPDVIDPDEGEPLGIPPGAPPEIPGTGLPTFRM